MKKTKKIIFTLLFIGAIIISSFSTTFVFNPDKKKTEAEQNLDDFHDFMDHLRTAGFQYTGLGITTDMDLYQNTPYYFYGQFWDSDNLDEAFTQGWLEYKIVGDDTTFEQVLTVPDNDKNGNASTSDIQYTDGYLHKDGNLEDQDGDYAVFNSSDGYNYPGTWSFYNDVDGTNPSGWSCYEGVATVSVIGYFEEHRKVVYFRDHAGGAQCYISKQFSDKNSGSIEYWQYMGATSDYFEMYLGYSDVSTITGNVIFYNGEIKVYNYHTLTAIDTFSANTWYHVRVDFDLVNDVYNYYINGTLKAKNFVGYNNPEYIRRLYFITDSTEHCDAYIDAIGCSWDTNYKMGANYYWQYYLGSKTFEEFDESIKQNFYGNYDFESYSLYNILGDYYGTNSFDNIQANTYPFSTESFIGQEGLTSTSIPFVDEFGGWTGDARIGDYCSRDAVLRIRDQSTGDEYIIHYFGQEVVEGYIEFWWRRSQTTGSDFYFYLRDDDSNLIQIRTDDSGNVRYYDSGWNTFSSFSINTWYHIYIEWNSTNFFIINDGDNSGSISLTQIDGIDEILIGDFAGAQTSDYLYIDAVGESWDPDYILHYNNISFNPFCEDGWGTNIDLLGDKISLEYSYYYHNYVLRMLDISDNNITSTHDFNGMSLSDVLTTYNCEVGINDSIGILSQLNNHHNVLNFYDYYPYYLLYSVPDNNSFIMYNGTKISNGNLLSLNGDYATFLSEFRGTSPINGDFTINPDGDVTTEWEEPAVGTHYTTIDEYPSVGTGDWIAADDTDDGQVEQFTLQTDTIIGNVTEIEVYVYGQKTAAVSDDLKADLYDGSGWLGEKTYSGLTTSNHWLYVEWTGLTLNQTQINALEVKFTAPSSIPTGVNFLGIYTVYVKVYYEQPGESYGVLNFTSTVQWNNNTLDPLDSLQSLKLNYGEKVNISLDYFSLNIWNFTSGSWDLINNSITTDFCNNEFTITSDYYNATNHIVFQWFGNLSLSNFELYLDLFIITSNYTRYSIYRHPSLDIDFSTQTSGLIELWFYIMDNTNKTIQINGDDGGVSILMADGYLVFYNGTYHNICAINTEQFYHLRVRFDTTNNWYLWLDEVYQGAFTYNNTPTNFNNLLFKSLEEVSNFSIDAIGFSWDPDYPVIGYNIFPAGNYVYCNFTDVSINNAISMWIYVNSTCRISVLDDETYISSIRFINNSIYCLDGYNWTYCAVYDGLWIHLVMYLNPTTNKIDYYINGTEYSDMDSYTAFTSFNRILIETESGRNSCLYLDAVLYGDVTLNDMWDDCNPYGLLTDLEDDGWDIYYKPYCSISNIYENSYHDNILNITDDSNTNEISIEKPGFDQEFGTIEFYIKTDNVSYYSMIQLKEVNDGVSFAIGDNYFRYWDGSWNDIVIASNNQWYHIRIDFECGSGGYEGLSADTYYLYINGTQYGAYPFINTQISITGIVFKTYTLNSSYSFYIDAIGYSWTQTYEVGWNANPYIEELIDTGFNETFGMTNNFNSYVYLNSESTPHKTYMILFDNSSSTYAQVYTNFTNTAYGSVEFWIRSPPTGKNCTILVGKDTSDGQVKIRFNTDDSLEYWDITWLDICNVDPETWYRIRVEFDCDPDTYNVYVNEKLEHSNCAFLFGRDYLNRLTIETDELAYNYNISVDSIGFCWENGIGYINNLTVECILDFNVTIQIQSFIEDPLEYIIYRYQMSDISQDITLFIYDFTTDSWYNLTVDNDVVWADIDDIITSEPARYVNSTNHIILRIYSINRFEEFKYYCDEFTATIYHKSLFNTTLTFYQMGIWKYRFHLYSVSLTDVYTDWVYFDVVEQPNNFEAISESRYSTEWILRGTGISVIRDVLYQDDLTADSWSLAEGGGDNWLRWENLQIQQDAFVWADHPTTNYGSDSDLIVGEYTGTTYDYASYFRYDFDGSNYVTDKMSGKLYYYVYDTPWASSEYCDIYTVEDFSESTITWNTQPATISHLAWTTDSDGWNSQSFTPTNFEDFNCFAIKTTSDPTLYYIRSTESGTNEPYVNWLIAKSYQNKAGEGYMYYQAKTSELVGIESPSFLTRTLTEGDTIVFDMETDQDNAYIRFLLGGVQQKEMPILQYNSIYTRQDVQILIDEDVTFDQIEIVSNLNNKEYVKIYNVVMYDVNYEEEEEVDYIYLQPYGEEERLLTVGETNLNIYENGILRINENITISYYAKYTKIFESTFTEPVHISLYDANNDLLDYNKFVVYANYTLNNNIMTDQRIFDPEFYCDEDTLISFLIYDSFDTLVYNYSRYAQTFIDITLAVYSLKIKNEAYEYIDYSLDKTGSSITKSGLAFSQEIISFSLATGEYTLTYINHENEETSNIVVNLTSARLITINTTYKEIYFALFTYDGFGLDPNLVRFYINGSRKDFGFNTITSRYVNLTVMDYFNYILYQQVIDTDIYNMAWNIYVEVYTLTILNLFNFEDIKMNISRGGYWMEQVIPMTTGLNFRFIPNVNYTLTAKYLNGTIIGTRYINLTVNGHIESFGETTPYPEEPFFPRIMWINLYNPYGFSITERLRIYINNSRIEGGSTLISTNSTNVAVLDYFDRVLYNRTVPYSRELNIQINTTTVIIHNEMKKAIIVRIKMVGDANWRISQALGAQDGLIFEFINGNYTIRAETMDGEIIDQRTFEIGTDEKIISFGFYEEVDIPKTPDFKVDNVWLDVLIIVVMLSVIIFGLGLYVYKNRNRNYHDQNLPKNFLKSNNKFNNKKRKREVDGYYKSKLYNY